MVMGPLGVAPAHVQAHPVGRYAGQGVLQDLHVHLDYLDELLLTEVRELGDPGHGQVGTIDLEQQPGVDDGVVVVLHHVGQGV